MPDSIDRSIEITRRRFLAGSAMAGFAAFLAACGTQGTIQTTGPTGTAGTPASAPPSTAPVETKGVEATYSPDLNWANWCCYLDVDPKDATKWKTLEDFKA